MTDDSNLIKRRIRWRATHRGTKEADLLIGGFCDRYLDTWGAAEIAWFEELLAEQDVDIMAWAFRAQEPPARFHGPQLEALMRLDYIPVAR